MLIKHFKKFRFSRCRLQPICNSIHLMFEKNVKICWKNIFFTSKYTFPPISSTMLISWRKSFEKKRLFKMDLRKIYKKMWFGCKYVFLQRPITYLTSFTTLTPYLVYSEFKISLLYVQKCMLNSQWWCHDVIIAI